MSTIQIVKKILSNIKASIIIFIEFLFAEIPNLLQILTSIILFALLIKIWEPNAIKSYAYYLIGTWIFIFVYLCGRAYFFISQKGQIQNKSFLAFFYVLLILLNYALIQVSMKVVIPLSISQSAQECVNYDKCNFEEINLITL